MLTRMGLFLLCIALGAILPFLTVTAQSDISQKAHDLHFSSIVVDTHDDTTQRLLDPKFDFGIRHNDGSIDIPRMREGNLSAIFFSIWISGTITGPEAVKRAMDQIDVVRELPVRYPKDIALARTADDVRRIHADGKIAALMGVEGGHMIDNDLGVLRDFARLGVRYMTLTHMLDTDWADPSTGKSTHNGLTDFGKQVVHEMNRMGIMVDISHVSDEDFLRRARHQRSARDRVALFLPRHLRRTAQYDGRDDQGARGQRRRGTNQLSRRLPQPGILERRQGQSGHG